MCQETETQSLTDRILCSCSRQDKSFSLFQYSTLIVKFCIIHTRGKTGKKSKHKMNERKTIFWHMGNSLISLMKYLNCSSFSKAPSIAPGYGCCGGCSHKEGQTTKKREQWGDSGGPLKMVVRRNISEGHL